MIVIAGGTGKLGTRVVERLVDRGLEVRILTREPERARRWQERGVDIVRGDVREPASLPAAMAGVDTVISAVHGFAGPDDVSPETVDRDGNRNLIRAAEGAGVRDFILVSIQGVSPDHPMELLRMKYAAETELRRSALRWTIIRPTAFMELWASMIGDPLVNTGKTRVFGRGENPINFVSIEDVARFVELAAVDEQMRGEVVEVGGPKNLTMNEVAATIRTVLGSDGPVSHVPRAMMRVMAVLMAPVKPQLARQIRSGVFMDTIDLRFDGAETVRRYPSITPTRFEDVARRVFGEASARADTTTSVSSRRA